MNGALQPTGGLVLNSVVDLAWLHVQEWPMSAAKRDNYVFSLAKNAEQATRRPMPRNALSRPDRTAQALALQGSWNKGTTRGSDPYNRSGPRRRG
jgi:hypothetical protein